MATTGQWVFEKAMALMDNLNESNGAADTGDNLEYKNRTLPILNLLLPECMTASDTFQAAQDADGKYPRPVPAELTDLSDPVPLDDGICRGALPYGLAAHLLLAENAAQASFFQQRYGELLARFRATVPAAEEDIADIYGVLSGPGRGRW